MSAFSIQAFTIASCLCLSACQTSPTNRPVIAPPTVSTASELTEQTANGLENADTSPAETVEQEGVSEQENPSEQEVASEQPSDAPIVQADSEPTSQNTIATTAYIPTSPSKTGELQNRALAEVSGLAASARYTNTFWAINDSGNSATLYAFNETGDALGDFAIAVGNRDWEDLAAANINGEPYLLIGDIGDNLRVKDENTIHVLSEPLLNGPAVDALQPIHTLFFRYPDEPHNAEALAYADGYVYILTKEPLKNGERQASKAFRIPLELTQTNRLLVAEEIASLAIPGNSIEASLIASIGGVDISQPTAFEIDSQNRHAYVLTYRSVYRYTRQANETWGEVLAQPRVRVHSHSLSQAEALAISREGVVWFTSEKRPAPLWALPAAER